MVEAWLGSLPLSDDIRAALEEILDDAPLRTQLHEVHGAIASLPPATQVLALSAIAQDPAEVLRAAVHAFASAHDRAENAEWCFLIAACAKEPELVYEFADERKLHGFAKAGAKKSTLFYLAKLCDGGWGESVPASPERRAQLVPELVALLLSGKWPKTEKSELGALAYGLLHHRPAELLRLITELPTGTKTARGDELPLAPQKPNGSKPLAAELFEQALEKTFFEKAVTLEQLGTVVEKFVAHDYRVWRASPAEASKQHDFLKRLAAAEKDAPVIIQVPKRPFLNFVGVSDRDLLCLDPTAPERTTRVGGAETVSGLCAPATFIDHFLEGKALPSLEAGDPRLHWFSR